MGLLTMEVPKKRGKSSDQENELEDNDMVLVFSNAKEFIPDENNSSTNKPVRNHENWHNFIKFGGQTHPRSCQTRLGKDLA